MLLFQDNNDLVITKCSFLNTSASYGAAIYVTQYHFGLTISDCSFTDIASLDNGAAILFSVGNYNCEMVSCAFKNIIGGGMFIDFGNSEISVVDTTFVDCYAARGAAVYVYVWNVNLKVENCSFVNSVASELGGAIHLGYDNDAVTLNRLAFTDCYAASGGAVYSASENDDLVMTNISFFGNGAAGDGGAVLIRDTNYHARLVNVHFASNLAGAHGGALAATSSNVDMSLTNCIFTNNTAALGGNVCYRSRYITV
jgi:hypothetical protein